MCKFLQVQSHCDQEANSPLPRSILWDILGIFVSDALGAHMLARSHKTIFVFDCQPRWCTSNLSLERFFFSKLIIINIYIFNTARLVIISHMSWHSTRSNTFFLSLSLSLSYFPSTESGHLERAFPLRDDFCQLAPAASPVKKLRSKNRQTRLRLGWLEICQQHMLPIKCYPP